MKRLVTALALTTLLVSPAYAYTRHHYGRRYAPVASPWVEHHHPGRLVAPLVEPRNGMRPAGTTWHDYARWGAPPMPTGTWARSQDGENYQPVDSYDVVLNGQIVGRDPDPNIRFQLMREAGFPAP